ncbi:peptidase M6 [Tumebacillus algifaecis]|uniref:Peptidase M6 n=1 Tax=Tumebacillus algifaecis TaxID=1214604 RepID=A0A223CYE9_9BACL|nr:immune inhibitor A domain-containing protein [Tumebacillus algifaecis]ASS74352.1 peptidase M6 [Tumebacillus algifaecis]
MKKFLALSVSGALVAGSLFTGTAMAAGTVQNGPVQMSEGGTLDVAIMNEDRLIESLEKQGKIPAGATQEQKKNILKSYIGLKNKEVNTGIKAPADPLASKVKASKSNKHKAFVNGKKKVKNVGNFLNRLDPVQETAYTGPVRKDKVLVLNVEFADFPHNNIDPSETDNYYSDYTLGHFEDMIFGDNGYAGPNGENLISMKKFYEQQSGGTYSVEGKAYGWLKVPGTAAFYGADAASGGHDNVLPGGSKKLVRDVYDAAKAAGIPLHLYDQEDPHDLDGDGNLYEPDGLVDHLMIIHSGVGQEAGGGSLGDNAIWSHRSATLYDPDGLGAGLPGFYDYTMMPEDGAVGVFAHEYGHDLGLPDEYDTAYSGTGEAVAYWSIMASGSWAGKIGGTEPTGFSPFAKSYFQSTMGGNWTAPTVVDLNSLPKKGSSFLLDQANSPNGKNHQAIQVNLPEKKTLVNKPTGKYEYFGGNGNQIDNTMITSVDLTGKSSATLEFDSWYKIEEDWDFAFVQVSEDNGATWHSLSNANTVSTAVPQAYPTVLSNLPGLTGHSNGWEKQTFDLSAYAGKKIQVSVRYITDWGGFEEGIYVDNVKVTADGAVLLNDGAEGATSPFTLNGFSKSDGYIYSDHYYLLEWRNHAGVDVGLKNIRRGASLMSYDGGLVVWYVDPSFTNNWTGIHPGGGFLGVVDAHNEENLKWSTGIQASTRYHIRDAAFSLNPTSALNLVYPTQTMTAASKLPVPLFDDRKSYMNTNMPDAGRDLTSYGLKVLVTGQSADKSVGQIHIFK